MSRHFGIHWVVTGITLCAACTDASTRIVAPAAPELDAVKFWEVGASTRWNERAIAVFGRHTVSNAQSALIRTLTYLSIAQHLIQMIGISRRTPILIREIVKCDRRVITAIRVSDIPIP
jgi:hypothetical protein